MNKQHYLRLKTVSLEAVIPVILNNIDVARKARDVIDGITVKVNSLRLKTFAIKGTKCSCCGLESSYFAFEKQKNSDENLSWHLNLYGVNSEGEEILFTHDHTLSRGLGGANTLKNTTTMCSPCNFKKSIPESEEARKLQKFYNHARGPSVRC